MTWDARCDAVARHFAADGLHYVRRRTRHRLEQRRGDLRLTLALWPPRTTAATLEVFPYVDSPALAGWMDRTGVGRNPVLFTAAPRVFTETDVDDLARAVRTCCWEPLTKLDPDAAVHPPLRREDDNYACWLWMRGRPDRALAVPGLSEPVRARLLAL